MPNNLGSSNLPPIVITPGPLVPDWAKEAVRRLNLICGATFVLSSSTGGFGSSAFSFSGNSAQMVIPIAGLTGSFAITKATSIGNPGNITVQNGIVTGFTSPT